MAQQPEEDLDRFLYGEQTNESEDLAASPQASPADAKIEKQAEKLDEAEEEYEDDEEDFEVVIEAPATEIAKRGLTTVPMNRPAASSTAAQASTSAEIATRNQAGIDINAVASYNGQSLFELDPESLEEKPWKKPGADLTDYFNFGFTENTWRLYCQKQKMLRDEHGGKRPFDGAMPVAGLVPGMPMMPFPPMMGRPPMPMPLLPGGFPSMVIGSDGKPKLPDGFPPMPPGVFLPGPQRGQPGIAPARPAPSHIAPQSSSAFQGQTMRSNEDQPPVRPRVSPDSHRSSRRDRRRSRSQSRESHRYSSRRDTSRERRRTSRSPSTSREAKRRRE